MTMKTGLNSSKYPHPAEMCIFMQAPDCLLEDMFSSWIQILNLVHANPCQNKQILKKEQAATYVVADSLHISFKGGNTLTGLRVSLSGQTVLVYCWASLFFF